MINWTRIIIYAACLFLAQLAIGFSEGWLTPGTEGGDRMELVRWFAASSLVSLVVCLIIFGHMGYRQVARPFLHAGLTMAIYGALSLVLAVTLSTWIGGFSVLLVSLEWLTLAAASVVGVIIGIAVRLRVHGRSGPRAGSSSEVA